MIYKVKESHTLLQFLKKILPKSNREIKKALEFGKCKINGKVERFASTHLRCLDIVEYDIEHIEEDISVDIPILFENEHYYLLNKPIHFECSEKLLLPRFPNCKLVHRLDKPTSGVFLLAKSEDSQKALSDLFRQRKIKKNYLAYVDKIVNRERGEISSYLVKKGHFHGQTLWGTNPLKKGLLALTYWELIEKGSDYSILRCYPKTGRTHQIRVHLKEMGHPILGDFQYCRDFHSKFKMDRLYLHSEQVSFKCPFSQKNVKFFAKFNVS